MKQETKRINGRKMVIMGLVGVIIATPFIISGIINEKPIEVVIAFLVLSGFIYWGSGMKHTDKDMANKESANGEKGLAGEGLNDTEKIVIIILSLVAPVISGSVAYYIWIKKFPKKANQANNISWVVMLIYATIYAARSYYTN